MAPKCKGFWLCFPKWAVYEMVLVFSISYGTWVLPFIRVSIKEDVVVVVVGVVVVVVAVVVA